MSPPSLFPAPPSSPATESASPSSQTAQAQPAGPTQRPLHRISISSLLTNPFRPTPPASGISSAEDRHAAKAPQVPPPESTTQPVNGSTVAATDVERSTAAKRLCSPDVRCEENEHHDVATAPVRVNSLSEALLDSPVVPANHKGKGKDPEIYDIEPTVHANDQPCHKDRSADDDAAETLPDLEAVTPETQAALILQGLRTKYVLTSPWSESEDEGPLPSAAPQISFTIPCHGHGVQYRANQGNAVFDLAPLRMRRCGLEDQRGASSCYSCETMRLNHHEAYEAGHGEYGCERFEHEDTMPLDDDDDVAAVADRLTDEERRAAEQEEDEEEEDEEEEEEEEEEWEEDDNDDAYLAKPPQMNLKTMQRLEAQRRSGTPEPEPPRMPPTGPPPHPHPRPAARNIRRRNNTAAAWMMVPSPLRQVQTASSESEDQLHNHLPIRARPDTAGGRAAAPSRRTRGSQNAGVGTGGEEGGGGGGAGGREAEEEEEAERGVEPADMFATLLRCVNHTKAKSARKRGKSGEF